MTKSRGVADWGHYPPVNNNILINPSFTVFQRAGTTLSGDWGVDHLGSSVSYGPDRWRLKGLDRLGGTKAQSSIDSSSGINKLVVEYDGATSDAYAYQYIEAINLLGLYGKEMTLSFSYSDVGGSGVPKPFIRSWDSSDNLKTLFNEVPTPLGNNRWTCTFTLTTEDGTIPDLNEVGMQVLIFINEGNIAPDEWSLWETKLEVGSAATPVIARSHGDELALCQRYYYTTGELQLYYTAAAYANGGTSATCVVDVWYPVTMRAAPILLPYTYTNMDTKSEIITPTRARLNGKPLNTANCAKVESPLIFDAEL